MKQKLLGLVLLFALAAAACSMFVRWEDAGAQVFTAGNSEEKTLIIDAGHGGEDGGAVSLSGVPESGLNLSIALKLDQLLGLCGYAPVLLRTQDVSLGTQGGTILERKTSDIRSRAERVESGLDGLTPEAVFITAETNYRGAQQAEWEGERYQIYRTYHRRESQEIELYLAKRTGVGPW